MALFLPIGPKVRNMNHEFLYSEGKQNQLDKWVAAGYLIGYTKADNIDNKMAKWDASTTGNINARARAYLDANCAHCHRKEGMANPSGLYLNYTNQSEGSLGFFKTPEAAGDGGGGTRPVAQYATGGRARRSQGARCSPE